MMTPDRMIPPWTRESALAASNEGWDIFYSQGSEGGDWQIQRFDSPEDVGPDVPALANDDEALRKVAFGSKPWHTAARTFIRSHNHREWRALCKFRPMLDVHPDEFTSPVGGLPWEIRVGTGGHACIYVAGTGHNVAIGMTTRDAEFIVRCVEALREIVRDNSATGNRARNIARTALGVA